MYDLSNSPLLLGVLGFSSCEVEDFTFRSTHTNEGLQVVGRLTTFSDRIVTSRGLKTNEESKISNMTLFIFDDINQCIKSGEIQRAFKENIISTVKYEVETFTGLEIFELNI